MSRASNVQTIIAKRLFPGRAEAVQTDMVIRVEDGLIVSITPIDACPPEDGDVLHVDTICPGFIDIQINGARDVQFNDYPTVEGITEIAAGARVNGTAHLLPTFVTAPKQSFLKAIEAVESAIESDVLGVLGIHLEGPFLSKSRPGIHPANAIRNIESSDIAAITQKRSGITLLTLAPEEIDPSMIEELTQNGVLVFAGHTEATSDDIRDAEASGLRGATHLFNAMSQIGPREPGVVGATLSSQNLYAGIIADGIHVHPANLKLAAGAMGDRLCLVTDAMQTLAGRKTSFNLSGKTIYLKNSKLSDKSGTLAGAHLAMDEAVRNAIKFAGVSETTALAMASSNPARALHLENELGAIKVGYRASLTILDKELHAQGVIVDGHVFVNTDNSQSKIAS